jgi:hypothetical protein
MEEVEESLAELWTEFGRLQHDGKLAAAMAPHCFALVNTARTRGEWREGADRRMPWRP